MSMPSLEPVPLAQLQARARKEQAKRRQRRAAIDLEIFRTLVMGASLADMAVSFKLPIRSLRKKIDAIVKRRAAGPALGFVEVQRARLHDALGAAHHGVMKGDLAAIDRMLKVMREMERFEGFRPPINPALGAPELEPALARPAPRLRLAHAARRELAPPNALPAPLQGAPMATPILSEAAPTEPETGSNWRPSPA